ncbi:hypothetical protein [Streptomyces sp. SPB4]|nr:hypothetical protein [Streptomyces sp. SPB4]MDH6544119.1 hypothetical protein [Streptomyces sp. SPB4]
MERVYLNSRIGERRIHIELDEAEIAERRALAAPGAPNLRQWC